MPYIKDVPDDYFDWKMTERLKWQAKHGNDLAKYALKELGVEIKAKVNLIAGDEQNGDQ